MTKPDTPQSLPRAEYTAVIKQADKCWIGWIEETPGVNCQEPSRDALIECLREALDEAIDLHRRDALAHAGDDYTEIKIAP